MSLSSASASNKIFRHLSSLARKLNLSMGMASLEGLNFDNLALRSLPIDPEVAIFTREVKGACFSRVLPTPVKNPQLVAYSRDALALLDLPESECKRGDLAQYFSGNVLLPGSETAAHCYCGHQFGYFSGQLGDGAAMYLGEIVNQKGERWELQLKGAGKTPYSRSADGRKVLRSSIREFLCSEVMNNLGVPTTRAGTVVTSDSRVTRDIFYTGHNIQERCSIVSRIAPTFIRFGSFEIFKPTDSQTGRKGPSHGRNDLLVQLTSYVIQTFYPEIWEAHKEDRETRTLEFFREITKRTARLVAKWQAVGFCHGVLNTDNMSIVGVTVDYGPFGFMDRYDPDFICNSSDDGGRYSYAKQPEICRWNCMKLAEALNPLVPLNKTRPILDEFDREFEEEYGRLMNAKFGFTKLLPNDRELIKDFFETMYNTGADFTNSFRILSSFSPNDSKRVLDYLLDQCCSADEMKRAFSPQMDTRQLQLLMMLQSQNPELLSMLGKQAGALDREMELMRKAEEYQTLTPGKKQANDRKLWSEWLRKYGDRIKEEYGENPDGSLMEARKASMNKANPRIVLRNWIAQRAIDIAEHGDYAEVRRVLHAFQDPYDEKVDYSRMKDFDEAAEEGRSNVPIADDDRPADAAGAGPSKKQRSCHISYDARPEEGGKIRVS